MPEPEKTDAPEPRKPGMAKIDAVRQFVEMMKDNDLTAFDFTDGPFQVRLRRGPRGGGHFAAPAPAYQAPAPPPSAPAPTAAPSPAPAAPAAPGGVEITSPMVGTYYSSSSPDAPSFVSVGSTVRADTTVCIIEAMKVFTDIPAGSAIPAGQSGTITEVLVQNGQAVEFGQPLFRVKLG